MLLSVLAKVCRNSHFAFVSASRASSAIQCWLLCWTSDAREEFFVGVVVCAVHGIVHSRHGMACPFHRIHRGDIGTSVTGVVGT